jgi:hypothetical protein
LNDTEKLPWPKGDRAKELSFGLWKEGKSLEEIQVQIGRDSKDVGGEREAMGY